MSTPTWHDVGLADALATRPVQPVVAGHTRLTLTFHDGLFGAIAAACNHAGGPLSAGTLDGEYVVCPWHHWKYHCRTGSGEPGYEADAVPSFPVKVEGGRVWIDTASATPRRKGPHAAHPLDRPVVRAPGPLRVAGISTTAMDLAHPRRSTSELLLDIALEHAASQLGATTQLLRLGALAFRHCEGYYSKSARACTWPCSITQMDPSDQMDRVYETIVHWADVLLVATPIRWGAPSSLYFKMAERLNCVQNQITLRNRALIRNKTVAFIITGGQDNIQGVAGTLLTFFGELGFHIPQFPFIAHSRGWTAEDMERNVAAVEQSAELHEAARELVARAAALATTLIEHGDPAHVCRAGRKAQRLDVEREAHPGAGAEVSAR